MKLDAAPRVLLLGGPNGAGKTTFSNFYFRANPWIADFVNADEIAKGLSAFKPEGVALEAGKIMLTRIRKLAADKANFAFESTLASRSFEPFLRQLSASGYKVDIVYLWLSSPETALGRVRDRVQKGGHSIPDQVVRRRYWSGLQNFFELYRPLAFSWAFYDNSELGTPVIIADGGKAVPVTVTNPGLWQKIEASVHDHFSQNI